MFTLVAQCLGHAGLIKGKTIGRDATTLEANAALRSIVRATPVKGTRTVRRDDAAKPMEGGVAD